MKFKEKAFSLPAILFLTLIARIVCIFFYGDNSIDNEWKILLINLKENNILSIRDINGEPVPNIFMPPLYPYFLYVIKIFFNNEQAFLMAVHTTQLLISSATVYFMYFILKNFFTKNINYLGLITFSLFPLNVYASSQVSSITLQLFLLTIYLLSFIKVFKKKKIKQSLILATSGALLILLRGEFFIFYILTLIYLFFHNKDAKFFLLIFSFSLLIVSPYLVRNYLVFETITITKSAGYNLLKGNNPISKVEGVRMFRDVGNIVPEVDSKLQELNKLGPIKKHDLLIDKIFLDQAVSFIKEDPKKYVSLYFKKFLSFIFVDIDSTYPKYYSILNILPKILISLTTIISIFLFFQFRMNIFNFLILYYFANIGLFSFFFILPRYNLSLLPIQIILSLYLIKNFKKNF